MTISFKDSTGNYYLDQLYDNKFPAGSLLQLRSGAPAGPNTAAGGTLGVEITLPATPWNPAASKAKTKNGVWSNPAVANIMIGHYILRDAADAEREEGTVTATGGGGDATVDNVSVAVGQVVTCTACTRTAP